MKIVICVNTAWNLVNFRSGLIRALVLAGHDVVAVAPDDKYAFTLKDLGCRFVPLYMENGGTNPLQDALLMWRFLRFFSQEKPDLYLGYTVKPNVYGSIAARMHGIPVINNISGLGAVFIKGGWLLHVMCWLYRTAIKRSAKVFFQNQDDLTLFIEKGIVQPDITELLPGSGIDLNHFTPSPVPRFKDSNLRFQFLLIARMLRDKGVVEFVEAARLLRRNWPKVEFCLLGLVDVKNPAAISKDEMDAWVAEGVVTYLGVSDDVRQQLVFADCVVLPSYREGTPRCLLEAAAMARPIITTDAVGCREVVDDGVNGYLCKVGDAGDLAKKMKRMLSLSLDQRLKMGRNGRLKIEREFDERLVIKKYLDAIQRLSTSSS